MTHRTATVLSEVFAPWLVNIAFFLVLGAASTAWPAAVTAAVGTGVVPLALIITLMRTGKVGNHHVTTREQRGVVLVGIALCVLGLIGVLTVLDTPPLIWTGVWAALVFLIGFGVVTVAAKIKASIHVGLWVCVVTFLGLTVSPWWFLALLLTPLIAWARVVIQHHSWTEILAGAVTGAVVTTIVSWVLL